jgi:hypothetical protein
MSIIINVADRSKNNSMISNNTNSNEKHSSSLIKISSNKLEKNHTEQTSNIVATYVTENSNKNLSNSPKKKENYESNSKFNEINLNYERNLYESRKKSDKNSVSVDIQLNLNNSLMSSGSFDRKGRYSKSIIHDNSIYYSNTSDKKQTLQTLTEKNICDEIEVAQAEADKCIDRME